MRPSWVWADSTTWSSVEGYTCPWASTSFSQMAMASGNDPVASSSAARQEVAQSVVTGHGEPVLERPHKRVGGILREGHEALADVAGRRDVGLLAQNAGAAAIIGHGHDGARLHAQGEQRPDGDGSAGAPADDHRLQRTGVLIQRPQVRKRAAQGRERRRGRRIDAEGLGALLYAGHLATLPFRRRQRASSTLSLSRCTS